MSIRVSVVMPTFNRAQLIDQTLECILNQEHPPSEIIVVNDGSTDNTVSIVESYGPPVKLINIMNIGSTGARSVGVEAATGDWLAFCDSDDNWHADHLSCLVELAGTYNVAFAFSNFTHVNSGKRAEKSHFEADPSGFWMKPGYSVGNELFVSEEPLFLQILRYQAMFPSCTFVNRTFYEAIGGFNPLFGRNPSEDFEFNLRCAKGKPAGIVIRPTVDVHRHSHNISGDWIRTISGSIEILRHARDNHGLNLEYRAAVEREIISRSINGIDCCFAQKRFEDVGLFLGNLTAIAIGPKTAIKIAVAKQPKPVALVCGAVLEAASSGARLWTSFRKRGTAGFQG